MYYAWHVVLTFPMQKSLILMYPNSKMLGLAWSGPQSTQSTITNQSSLTAFKTNCHDRPQHKTQLFHKHKDVYFAISLVL